MSDYLGPDLENAVLLTIDLQNDFVLPEAPAEVAGTAEVVPGVWRLVQSFRERGRPIVHVVRMYRPDGSNADLCRRRGIEEGGCVVHPGSEGAELVDEVKLSEGLRLDAGKLLAGELQTVGPNEWVMYKPRWGAFYKTPLEEHLAGLGVTTLVVCGCNFPNCPRATIYEASERDFRIAFVPEATSGVYERGLRELENIGVRLMSVEEVSVELAAKLPDEPGGVWTTAL